MSVKRIRPDLTATMEYGNFLITAESYFSKDRVILTDNRKNQRFKPIVIEVEPLNKFSYDDLTKLRANLEAGPIKYKIKSSPKNLIGQINFLLQEIRSENVLELLEDEEKASFSYPNNYKKFFKNNKQNTSLD